jgi:hypothetical protein
MVKFLNMSLSCPKSKSFDLLSILRYRFWNNLFIFVS